MRYHFNKGADKWLMEKGFSEVEKEELLGLLNRFEKTMKRPRTELIVLPKGVSGRVAAVFDLLYSVTDADGVPTCFEKAAIRIPEEAKKRFSEATEIYALEEDEGKLKKAKFARGRMDPRKRSSKYG